MSSARIKSFLMAFALSMSMGLTACTNTNIGVADRATRAASDTAADKMFQAQMPLQPDTSSVIEETDEVWAGGHALRADHGLPLPYQWESIGVTLQHPNVPLSMRQIAQKITSATNIPVVFAPDVFGMASSGGGTGPTGAPSQSGGQKPVDQATNGNPSQQDDDSKQPSSGAMAGTLAQMGLSSSNDGGNSSFGEAYGDEQKMVLTFHSGPLSSLLNDVTSYFGLTWRYEENDGGRIVIFRNINRMFHITALPLASLDMSGGMTQDLNSAASGGGGQQTASSSGQNNQNTTSKVSIKIWEEIENALKQILDGQGTVVASRSTGTISVVAPSQVMDKAQSYIDSQNAILSKQIHLAVEVFSVQMSASDALTLDLNGMIQKASKYAAMYGSGGTSALVADAAAGQALNLSINNNGASKGTQFLIQELSQIGNVEMTTNADLMTLNGLPVPLQVAHTQGYLAEVQTMNTGIGGGVSSDNSQTTLTPGSVTYGFNMMVLPRVMPNGHSVMLYFGASLSNLVGAKNGFDDYSNGNMSIQLPNMISRNFMQQAMVPNGKTVYLSGFQQTDNTANKKGTGKADMIALGGSQSGSRSKTMVVISVTPTIVSQNVIDYSDAY